MVYQFHSIEILQDELPSILMLIALVLAVAAEVVVIDMFMFTSEEETDPKGQGVETVKQARVGDE